MQEEKMEKSAGEEFVYRICPEQEWRSAQAAGALQGGDLDSSSGYIHLSTSSQVEGTLSRFYAGQDNLYLLKIDAAKLGDGLRYGKVEGVGTFPHFYGPNGAFSPLPLIAVESSCKLPLENNKHVLSLAFQMSITSGICHVAHESEESTTKWM